MHRTLIASVALVIVVAACGSGADGSAEATVPSDATASAVLPTTLATTSTTMATTTTTQAAATEATTTSMVDVTATTSPPSGQAGPGCVEGWVTPTPGTALRTDPLDVIREQQGITGDFLVVEMRYFTGPPPLYEESTEVFEWWYVKAQLFDDPTYKGRFLVRRDSHLATIVAAAPFDTNGWESPDWHSFEGVDSGPEGSPHPVEGLPGLWSGVAYDSVTGEDFGDGETRFPELPDELVGCFDST